MSRLQCDLTVWLCGETLCFLEEGQCFCLVLGNRNTRLLSEVVLGETIVCSGVGAHMTMLLIAPTDFICPDADALC